MEKLDESNERKPERRPDELPLWMKGPMVPENHGGDPEKAWRLRQKELLRWYEQDGSHLPEPAPFVQDPGTDAQEPEQRSASPDIWPEGNASGGWPEAPIPNGNYQATQEHLSSAHPRDQLPNGPYREYAPEHGGGGTGPGGGSFLRSLRLQTVAAAVLFAGAVGVSMMHAPWAVDAKSRIRAALTEDMDVSRAAAWYERTFDGSPSLLPAFGSKTGATKVHAPVTPSRFVQPVKGQIKAEYTAAQQGLWLITRRDARVAAMDDGRIEYAGDRPETGYTLVVQHADGYRMTYGGLKPAKWETGDWVKAGDVIGTVRDADAQGTSSEGTSLSASNVSGELYLAVMQDQRYVDPADVVAFD